MEDTAISATKIDLLNATVVDGWFMVKRDCERVEKLLYKTAAVVRVPTRNSRQDYRICIQRLAYFYSERKQRTIRRSVLLVLTISVIVFNMASRHLLNMENRGYSGALGTFLMGGNGNLTGYLDASNSVAVNSIESS